MKTYIIKSNYEYEIQAKNKEEALEKWHEIIGEELAYSNKILSNEFCESLYAKKI